MKLCPGCAKEVSVTAKECQFCGIIFEKWFSRQATPPSASQPLLSTPRSQHSATQQRQLVMFGVFLAVLAIIPLKDWYEKRQERKMQEMIAAGEKINQQAAAAAANAPAVSPDQALIDKFKAMDYGVRSTFLSDGLDNGIWTLGAQQGATYAVLYEDHIPMVIQRLKDSERQMDEYNKKGRSFKGVNEEQMMMNSAESGKYYKRVQTCWEVLYLMKKLPLEAESFLRDRLNAQDFNGNKMVRLISLIDRPSDWQKADVMASFLAHRNSSARYEAIKVLTEMGPAAASALPALKARADENLDDYEHNAVLNAIAKIEGSP